MEPHFNFLDVKRRMDQMVSKLREHDFRITPQRLAGVDADAHRHHLGVNYKQIPVNRPKAPVHSYSKDGAMRVQNVSDPVYAPNSKGGPQTDGKRYPETAIWEANGEFIRAAYTLRKDDDFGQDGTNLKRKLIVDHFLSPRGWKRVISAPSPFTKNDLTSIR